jgi:hypothetical protein
MSWRSPYPLHDSLFTNGARLFLSDIPHLPVAEARVWASPAMKARSLASSVGIESARSVDGTGFRARERRLGRLGAVPGRSGTHLTGQVVVVHRSRSSCRERRRPRPQAFDPAEDLGEQGARHRYLGQLEHHNNNYRGATLAPTLISVSRRSRQRPKALF